MQLLSSASLNLTDGLGAAPMTKTLIIPHPTVSVILPVFNGQKHLHDAIESILGQTFTDFELVIVNDGSYDKSVEIIDTYCADDARVIRVENSAEDKGLVGALNLGMSIARGKFIARMDADDIAYPNRLGRQVNFLEVNQDIDLCGSWVKPFGKVSHTVWQYPLTHAEIALRLLFNNAFAHPSIMFRKELLAAGYRYDRNYPHAEDYELFTRLSDHVTYANIPEVLLQYRTHEQNVGTVHSVAQQETAKRIQTRELAKKGIFPNERELLIHRQLEVGGYPKTEEFLAECKLWLARVGAELSKSWPQNKQLIESFVDSKLHEVKQSVGSEQTRPMRSLRATLKEICKRRVPVRYHKYFLRYVRPAAGRFDRSLANALDLFRPKTKLARTVKPDFKIGFTILAHERAEYLELSLSSLFSSNVDGYDITFIIQDDGSTDPRVREIIERPRDPKYKIVRRYTPKGGNSWGAAFNKAMRHMLENYEFDIVGTCDSDALFNCQWLDETMKVCLWAKQNHKHHTLGPFSSFNSSDIDFHRSLGSFPSPYGRYTVKERMGALNYIYFREDFIKLGYFPENRDDETLMTQRLRKLRVRNFSTDISYVEHIGQLSVLNQWRPVPVARAVYGLNLASTGWPSELENLNTLGYFKDVKGKRSVSKDRSDVPISVVFVATSKDFETLKLSIESVRRNLMHPVANIYVISPHDQTIIAFCKSNAVVYVDETSLLVSKKSDIQYRTEDGVDRSGWLFQQLLKYAANTIVETEHYLVIDADTVLVTPQRFIVDGKPVLLHSDEFHRPYFDASRKLLGLNPVVYTSCVAHQMMFSKKFIREMISHIESLHGISWELAIRTCTDYSESSGFSEYETYGQWLITMYPEKIEREYWFNLSCPRSNLKILDSLTYGQQNYRSVSFHWYL